MCSWTGSDLNVLGKKTTLTYLGENPLSSLGNTVKSSKHLCPWMTVKEWLSLNDSSPQIFYWKGPDGKVIGFVGSSAVGGKRWTYSI